MNPKGVQRWGMAPTPLVPKPLRDNLGHLGAPQELKRMICQRITLAELDASLWEKIDSVSSTCISELIDILKPYRNDFEHLCIYSGKLPAQLLRSLPFSTRTRNAVFANPEAFSAENMSFRDVLLIPALGIRSAIEFACVIESSKIDSLTSAESSSLLLTSNYSHINTDAIQSNLFETNQLPLFKKTTPTSNKFRRSYDLQEKGFKIPPEINSFFQAVSAWALIEGKMESLASVLPTPLPDWPPKIQKLWSELTKIGTRELAGDLARNYKVPELVSQALIQLDERLRMIAMDRVFAVDNPVTLKKIGQRLNVTRERVRQLENKVRSHLEYVQHANFFQPVIERASYLHKAIGNAVPRQHHSIEDELDCAVEDFSNDNVEEKRLARGLLLWLAGPYETQQNWLLKDKSLIEQSIEALEENQDQRGLITHDNITEVLSTLGIRKEHHRSWVEHLNRFLYVEDGLIYFRGNILDKAYSLLRYFDKPMATEQMLKYTDGESLRSVQQRLIDDPRFWRINKQNEFVLSETAGYDEYTGITDAIIQEIKLCGGQASVAHLLGKISRAYGVKKNSVTAYLSVPKFIKDSRGMVRVRDIDESNISVSADITKAASCYQDKDGSYCWRTKIDKNIMRGSGSSIPNAFAQKLGCNINNKLKVATELGPLTLSWLLTSTVGASVGSLRQILDYYEDASIEDYLFIKATMPEITFSLLKQEKLNSAGSSLIKLALLVSNIECATEDEAISIISTALDVNWSSKEETLFEIGQKLTSRGETDLLQFIYSKN